METPSLTEILARNKELEKLVSREKLFRVKILGNVITYPIKEYLENVLLKFSVFPEVSFGDYDNIAQESSESDDRKH